MPDQETQLKVCSKCGIQKPLTQEHWVPAKEKKSGWRSECRICKNKRLRNAYRKDPTKFKERDARYKENNRDKVLDRMRQYHKKHKEKHNASARQYRLGHKERITEMNKQWRERNTEYLARYYHEWAKNNPLKHRMKGIRRRALKQNAVGNYTPEDFINRLQYYGFKCAYCKCELTEQSATADHRIPLSRGGTNFASNIVPACRSCNSSKGIKTETEYRNWMNMRCAE